MVALNLRVYVVGWLESRCDGQYAARCTLNSCLVGVVIALPQKRSDESNGTLVDNTEGISCFGIRDYLDNYCLSLPCLRHCKKHKLSLPYYLSGSQF